MKVRAIRGATTVDLDSQESIEAAVSELLSELFSANGLKQADLISIYFTSTPDLVSEFPATAARKLGLSDTPLICSSEIAVPGSLEKCIRVMVHAYTALEKSEIKHQYLRKATSLRKDLTQP